VPKRLSLIPFRTNPTEFYKVFSLRALPVVAAFLGHLYPVYTKFHNGGKGVATAMGCFIVISPLAGIIVIIVFSLGVWASKRVSVGSSAALPAAV